MKKSLLHVMMGLMIMALGAASVFAFTFTDVPQESLYYDPVMYLHDEEIVQGYSDGSFGYSLPINRAELLKIVVEAKFLDEPMLLAPFSVLSCFDDVPANQWYTKYVCYADAAGWVNGYADGNFRPEKNINFVEALKIVLQVFDVTYPETEPWYRGMVETASRDNLIPLTIHAFGQVITRSEMADLIVRKIKFDAGELNEFLGPVKASLKVDYETISDDVHVDELLDDVVLPVEIISATGGNDEIYFEVSEVELGEGQLYYVKCDKVEGYAGARKPSTASDGTEFYLKHLANDTAYECFAAVEDRDGIITRQGETVTVSTLPDETQLEFESSYNGADYIFMRMAEVDLEPEEQYYFRCMEEALDNRSQPIVTTTVNYAFLNNLNPDTYYLCYATVMDSEGFLESRFSEYRWIYVADQSE